MKLPKKFGKKIVSVALCTIFLSAGSLQSITNVSHASTITNQSRATANKELWRVNLNFKLKYRNCPSRKIFATVNLIATEDRHLKMEYNSSSPTGNLRHLLFDDEFLIGFRSKDYYIQTGQVKTVKWLLKNNSSVGTHAYMSDASSLKDFIDEFNKANVKLGDYMFMHGVNYDDTLTFSSDKITRPSSKDYSLGYKSRGINKWNYGFELTSRGLYECPLAHSLNS